MSGHQPQITVVPKDRMGAVAGALVGAAVARCIAETGHCRLAVAGGSSPPPAFRWLAENLPGELARHLTVTTLDERHLPRTGDGPDGLQPEHNLRSLREDWIDRALSPPAVLSMVRPGTLDEALESYADDFVELGGIDVVLLGVGPDGHVASLFPGHRALGAETCCIAVSDSPKPPAGRLTLALEVLNGAREIVLMAAGEGKAAVLARVFAGDRDLPLGRVGPQGPMRWVLDPAAASALDRQP